MLDQIKSSISKYHLLEKGNRVLVAVSGGVDSVALLHLLYRLKSEYSLTLIVAHLNHMIRGLDANRDEGYVKNLSRALGLTCVVKRINVPEILKGKSMSPEDGARQIRYKFLKETALKHSADKVALGHHLDDQAETVLLHFLQGAGLDGLKGMSPQRGIYIRPLLEVKKLELEQYCKDSNLSFCVDATNYEDSYLRNKIRNRLIPLLVHEFNPNAVETLANTAKILNEENLFLDELVSRVETDSRILLDHTKKTGTWSTKGFKHQSVAIQRRFVRKAFKLAVGSVKNLSFKHVESIRTLIYANVSGNRIALPGRMLALYSYQKLDIMPLAASRQAVSGCPNYSYRLIVPGEVELKEINCIIKCSLLTSKCGLDLGKNETIVYLEPEDFLIVRNRRPGDRMRPLGMLGSKKLKALFIDEKIPRDKRQQIPVVLSKKTGKIIWVAGVKAAEGFEWQAGRLGVLLKLICCNL